MQESMYNNKIESKVSQNLASIINISILLGFSKNIREKTKARDDYTCQRCGFADCRCLEVHHIVPTSKGGDNSLDNAQTLCSNCHKIVHHEMDQLQQLKEKSKDQLELDLV